MTEMWNPNNPAHVGPQITARPGTKRHLKQVQARATFFAVQAASATGKAKCAQAEYEAAKTRTAELRAQLSAVELVYLALSEPRGSA
jgi:hypothetical protein